MEYSIVDSASEKFILLSDRHGSPRPLRRIFSLIRRYSGKSTILVERCKSSSITDCDNINCKRRRESCKNYYESLRAFGYDSCEKTCTKYYCFQEKYTDVDELLSKLENQNICVQAYCMVHEDELKRSKETILRSYVVESILSKEFVDIYQVVSGEVEFKLNIGKIKKVPVKGFYFCQQNAVTNCCAHAALKMAIRSHYPSVTAQKISSFFEKKIQNKYKNDNFGLSLTEMQTAIEIISENRLCTFSVDSLNMSVPEFLNILYVAIESRLPVLLCFDVPPSFREAPSGHVVALVGHTFTPNHWGAYGGMYFLKGANRYTPSSYLSGSFVINDDNIGPLYNIPLASLATYIEYSKQKEYFEHAMNAICANHSQSLSMKALIVWPQKYSSLSGLSLSSIFNVAVIVLEELIIKYAKYMPRDNEAFNIFFYDFYRMDISGLGRCAERLILRPFFGTVTDYFNKVMTNIYKDNYVKTSTGCELTLLKFLNDNLPERLWVIEISIPELFWINKQKVGEIIIDPEKLIDYFNKMKTWSGDSQNLNELHNALINSILIVRIPFFILINMRLDVNDYSDEKTEFYYHELRHPNHYQPLTTEITGVLNGCG